MRSVPRLLLLLALGAGCKNGSPPPAVGPTSTVPSPTDPAPTEPGVCASRAADACGADCAEIGGSPAEQNGTCRGKERGVGCMEKDEPCDDAITYATDPNGAGWWFMDTCIPPGWTSRPYPNGEDAPPCEGG